MYELKYQYRAKTGRPMNKIMWFLTMEALNLHVEKLRAQENFICVLSIR